MELGIFPPIMMETDVRVEVMRLAIRLIPPMKVWVRAVWKVSVFYRNFSPFLRYDPIAQLFREMRITLRFPNTLVKRATLRT